MRSLWCCSVQAEANCCSGTDRGSDDLEARRREAGYSNGTIPDRDHQMLGGCLKLHSTNRGLAGSKEKGVNVDVMGCMSLGSSVREQADGEARVRWRSEGPKRPTKARI